ncbi:MAG: tRNA pseudouridine(55) synthase TruB [Oscillospiraceae bacterium]|nr:tRNA pseudouridine(55) synthase TruB [Oscillospiraceae bacterium]
MDGAVLIDKEKGVSSFDVVRKVKKLTNLKSVGHTGTLDPLATGLLTIVIGKATSLSDYLMAKDKVYIASLILGIKTTTYDMEGEIIAKTIPLVNIEDIKKSVEEIKAIGTQKPPAYSAIKIDGKKAYELARKNIIVDLKEREIKIFSIDILSFTHDILKLRIHCSKGTYIRSIANDLGEMLGCGATIQDLRRVQSGNFCIENSVELSQLTEENIYDHLISPEDLLREYEILKVPAELNKKILNGIPVFCDLKDGYYRIYFENSFFGFGKIADKKIKVIKKFV